MFRAPDIWDVPKVDAPKLTCGFSDGLTSKYKHTGRTLGKGGFGTVSVVQSIATGAEYACKSIQKLLDVPNVASVKQQQHLTNIKQEVSVLRKLRGTLNVVHLEDVFEDDTHVHIAMELCRGGELLSKINTRHYSERTVASYMRAVLRTLAQCHHHRILHRDIKPGNFMLLNEAENSPIKAIDFGLAVFFDPKTLPRRDLGLEGTPHYMAPEALSSEVYPSTDVWAAGVMAYQLLSGRFPFDDWKNLRNPALSQLWKSILTDEPKFTGAAWAEVSDGAKDFITQLLTKDVHKRPSAQQALAHPWIQGKSKQRTEGKPLATTIVQRLQRFSTENAFKRTVLDMIANELLLQHLQQLSHPPTAPLATPVAPPTSPPALYSSVGQAAQPAPMLEAPRRGSLGSAPPDATPAVAAAGGDEAVATRGSSVTLPQKRKEGALVADPSNPQVRSQAAVSLLRTLREKSATVHAGSAVSNLLQFQAALRQGSNADRGSSFDLIPSSTQQAAPAPSVGPSAAARLRSAPGDGVPGQGGGAATPAGRVSEDATGTPARPPAAQKRDSEDLILLAHLPMPEGHDTDSEQHPGPGGPGSTAGTAGAYGGRTVSYDGAGVQAPSAVRGTPAGLQHSFEPNQHFAAVQQSLAASAAAAGAAGGGTAASRRMLAEGSGHALQHYAFLLAAGERSLHGLSARRGMGRSHSTASLPQHHIAAAAVRNEYPPLAGGLGAAAAPAGPEGADHMRRSGAGAERSSVSEFSVGTPPYMGPLSTETDSMHRLLGAVQRQRQEHRKLHRLMLDMSGHGQSLYDAAHAGERMPITPLQSGTVGPEPSLAEGLEAAGDEGGYPGELGGPLQQGALGAGDSGDTTPHRKSLLHKVSRAILKPVKDLLSSSTAPSREPSQTPLSSQVSAGGLSTHTSVTSAADAGQPRRDAPTPRLATTSQGGGDTTSAATAAGAGGKEKEKDKKAPAAPLARTSALTEALHAASAAAAGSGGPGAAPFPGQSSGGGAGGVSPARTGPAAAGAAMAAAAATATDGLSRPSRTVADVIAASTKPPGAATHVTAPTSEAPGEGRARGAGLAVKHLEEGGRGQGAYAALLGAQIGAGPDVSGQGTTSGDAPSGEGAGGKGGGTRASELLSIHTVKAHRRDSAVIAAAAADAQGPTSGDAVPADHTIAAQLARIEQAGGARGAADGQGGGEQPDGTAARVGGTVSRGTVFNVLGNLLGGPAQLAEFQHVLKQLNYDNQNELSFQEISEGLQMLGYKLEPSEVETLLSEVALGGDHLSQAAFLASQVDWRQFQANHREEWLALLRKTFNGLARDTDGRIGEDQIVALLSSKLPEEQVNLAVQETLLDAAMMGAEGLDFDDFARLLRADSDADLLSIAGSSVGGHSTVLGSPPTAPSSVLHGERTLARVPSIDLYDARMDSSLHGKPTALTAAASPGILPPPTLPPSAVVPGRSPLPAPGAGPPSPFGAVGVAAALPPSWLAGQLPGHAASAHHVHAPLHMAHVYQPGLETVVDQDDGMDD